MKYPYSQHEIHIVNTALNKKNKQKSKQNKPIALAFCICLINSSWSTTCLVCTNRVCTLVERPHPKQSLWNLRYTTLFTEWYNADKPLLCHYMPALWVNRFSVLALITTFKEWIWSVLCTIIILFLLIATNCMNTPMPVQHLAPRAHKLFSRPLVSKFICCKASVGFWEISFHFAYLYHWTCTSSLSFSII